MSDRLDAELLPEFLASDEIRRLFGPAHRLHEHPPLALPLAS